MYWNVVVFDGDDDDGGGGYDDFGSVLEHYLTYGNDWMATMSDQDMVEVAFLHDYRWVTIMVVVSLENYSH